MRLLQLAGVGLLLAALTGCGPELQVTTCRDYVSFEGDPSALAESSDLVFVGEVLASDGLTLFNEVDAATYRVRIDEVLKGEFNDSEIRVVSVPDGCTTAGEAAEYSDGDQLDIDGDAQFFLRETDGSWTTFSPFEGVFPVDSNGELYWDPSAPSPSPTH